MRLPLILFHQAPHPHLQTFIECPQVITGSVVADEISVARQFAEITDHAINAPLQLERTARDTAQYAIGRFSRCICCCACSRIRRCFCCGISGFI